jgi:hypothetical protein
MLVKDPHHRITISKILNDSFIIQLKSKPENIGEYPPPIPFTHSSLSTESEALHFTFNSDDAKGIFQYLSEIPLQTFINEILVKQMHKGNFELFKFLCCSGPISLSSTKHESSFQFSFKTKKVFVEEFFIQFNSSKFPLKWKLEASTEKSIETNAWSQFLKNKINNVQDQKIFFYFQFKIRVYFLNSGLR